MKRPLIALILALLFSSVSTTWAQGSTANSDLLAKLLAIAEPDQLTAFAQLRLTDSQHQQLRGVARQYLPRVEQAQSQPAGIIRLIPEALGAVDEILTPEQRPLARKLIPRSHQWPQLRALYEDYRR